jgi:putative acetyltransferase
MFFIRSEQPGDQAAIRAVHEAAFPTPAEGNLVDALRAAGRLTLSLVGLVDHQLVGHVAFSPLTVPAGLGLAPIAVLPARQRRGLGGQLIRESLKICREKGTGFVVVLGSPDYYGRFGFRPASRWGLQDEYGGGDAFQLIELIEGSVPVGHGLVQYSPEFSMFA